MRSTLSRIVQANAWIEVSKRHRNFRRRSSLADDGCVVPIRRRRVFADQHVDALSRRRRHLPHAPVPPASSSGISPRSEPILGPFNSSGGEQITSEPVQGATEWRSRVRGDPYYPTPGWRCARTRSPASVEWPRRCPGPVPGTLGCTGRVAHPGVERRRTQCDVGGGAVPVWSAFR